EVFRGQIDVGVRAERNELIPVADLAATGVPVPDLDDIVVIDADGVAPLFIGQVGRLLRGGLIQIEAVSELVIVVNFGGHGKISAGVHRGVGVDVGVGGRVVNRDTDRYGAGEFRRVGRAARRVRRRLDAGRGHDRRVVNH